MNTTIITPDRFKAAFDQIVAGYENQIIKYRFNDRDFTKLMLNYENGVLHSIANSFNLLYYNEYWTLDAIMYKENERDHFPGVAHYATNLSIAIEHENEGERSNEEMNKLSLFNAPLKVLITYPPTHEVEGLLNMYSDISKKADVFNDFTDKRRQMVIFGNFDDKGVLWRHYIYKDGEFVPI